MNCYVSFTNSKYAYLNLEPLDPDKNGFIYFSLINSTMHTHKYSYNNYTASLETSPVSALTYFFTPASTLEELYSLHPELLI